MKGVLVFGCVFALLLAGCRRPGEGDPLEAPAAAATVAPATPPGEPAVLPATAVAPSPTATREAAPTLAAAADLPSLGELGPGWNRLEPGGESRCAHDTPFSFWVRPGAVNKLLVFFQGGGGCWSYETCAPGSSYYNADVTEQDGPAQNQGLLDLNHPQNPFRDHHVVYIPSCTGDVYMGDNVQRYSSAGEETLTIYHRGYVNASTALAWASENVPGPDSVFVTGCSAGSVGSIFFAPTIIEQYPDATVAQMGDSLAFVFPRAVDMETDYAAGANFPEWIPAVAALDPSSFLMADFYTAVANYYPETTFSQFNTQADSVQTFFFNAVATPTSDFPAELAESLSRIHAGATNFRSYTAGGELHCITPRGQFYGLEVGGVPLHEWVASMAAGRPVDNVLCPTCQVELEP
jgi:hypothetical protein